MEVPKAIKIYKILLDIIWQLSIFLMAGVILVNLFWIIKNGKIKDLGPFKPSIEIELPKTDFSKFKNTYNFVLAEPEKVLLEISEIDFKSIGDSFIIIQLLFIATNFGLAFFQLKLFRDLLRDVIGSKIFTPNNIQRLKIIAFVELLTIPIILLYYFGTWALIYDYKILDQSLSYAPDYFKVIEALPRALEYLIFAGIFNFGLKIKKEQDLTI